MRTDKIVCRAIKADCSWWSLVCPDFSQAFVNAIKGIPGEERSWDPKRLAWVVSGAWLQHAADLAKKHFPGSEVVLVEEADDDE